MIFAEIQLGCRFGEATEGRECNCKGAGTDERPEPG
jgi:hypothetical protein